MAAHSKPVSEHAVILGKADYTHRTSNNLTQQDYHNWGTDRKQKLFNSQQAYWERGLLMPKHNFFIAKGALNQDMANEGKNGFKFIQKETTRKRLQKAIPFKTHDGRIATATDYFSMFIGEQEINPLYVGTKEELTEEFCNHYGHSLEEAFNKIARERMLTPKKAWQELTQVEKFPQDLEYQTICQDVLRGAHELTKEEALGIVEVYAPKCNGQCPCYHALSVLADDKEDPVDISDLKKENERLLKMM